MLLIHELARAAREGDVAALRRHVTAANVNRVAYQVEVPRENTSVDGPTLLGLAAWRGHAPAVELLLQRGANVEAQNELGRTALHRAAEKNHTQAIEVLLKYGANVEARTARGRTALHMAAEENHTQAIEVLLAHDAKRLAKDREGRTALHLAASHNHTEAINALLAHDPFRDRFGGNIMAKDKQGRTALHLAAYHSHPEAIKALLAHDRLGDCMVATDKRGRNVLHMAVEGNSSPETFDLLLVCYRTLEVEDAEGYTPLLRAAQRFHEDAVEALWNFGANKDAEDPNGRSALELMASIGFVPAEQLLEARGGANTRDLGIDGYW